MVNKSFIYIFTVISSKCGFTEQKEDIAFFDCCNLVKKYINRSKSGICELKKLDTGIYAWRIYRILAP